MTQNAAFHSLENLSLEMVQLQWTGQLWLHAEGKVSQAGLLLPGCGLLSLLRGVGYPQPWVVVSALMFPAGEEDPFEYFEQSRGRPPFQPVHP